MEKKTHQYTIVEQKIIVKKLSDSVQIAIDVCYIPRLDMDTEHLYQHHLTLPSG